MNTQIALPSKTSLLIDQLRNHRYHVHHDVKMNNFSIRILAMLQHLVLTINMPNGQMILLLLNHLTKDEMRGLSIKERADGLIISYKSSFGLTEISLEYPDKQGLFHYHIDLTPCHPMFLSDLEQEGVVLKNDLTLTEPGNIFLEQIQLRSGICFFDFGQAVAGSLFYFQNFSTLHTYAEDSQVSFSDCVKINWPHFGLTLPTAQENPLEKGKKYKIRDTYLLYGSKKPKNTHEIATEFLHMLTQIYSVIPKPACTFNNLLEIKEKCLQDLFHYKGCWQQVKSDAFLNAYLNDYDNPAESMVQLAVLWPLMQHNQQVENPLIKHIITTLQAGITQFFDPSLKTMVRWIPEDTPKLDQSEEQKKARVMDSWYLHHPLLHVAFILLSGQGNLQLEQQFISSIKYCIRVARHFKYQWPIFYDLDTLAILKKEAAPGEGGEKDVAGLYAFLLLKAYQITNAPKYLKEAERAVRTLKKHQFNILYQANNTAYTAEALLELWCISGRNTYLKLFEVSIANLLKNTAIWNMNYGHAKSYNTFFMLFPLKDAPYAALFEEQECAMSFNRILEIMQQKTLPVTTGIALLLSELVKYIVNRLPYYYPPNLPQDILSDKVKTGYLDPKAWIPLEDLGDGWNAPGSVGQEVYGAGGIFNVVSRHCLYLDEPDAYVQISYPISNIRRDKGKVSFEVMGTQQGTSLLTLVTDKTLNYTLLIDGKKEKVLHKSHPSLEITGGQKLTIKWK